jgi:hypothetical protein
LHAAQLLANRKGFEPKVLYTDTWPAKNDFWPLLYGSELEGRLGLFHYVQRIMRTLRKKHVDYLEAITSLLQAVYSYHAEDYERLITALKKGKMSQSQKKYTDEEIAELKATHGNSTSDTVSTSVK